jgi:type IV pilus assembly protein PilP
MQKYFKVFSMVSALVCFSILLNESDCFAKSSRKPIVIRKKITAPKGINKTSESDASSRSDSKVDLFKPKSDIAFVKTDVAPLYDPEGKIDPFEPLFKETPKNTSGSPTYADNDRKPIYDLEKIDLSQLRLSGIILAASGNRALVQEASGKGHVISKGTYIGTHGGRVTAVMGDKVIIEEKMKDVRGRFFFRKTELKIRNKPGI